MYVSIHAMKSRSGMNIPIMKRTAAPVNRPSPVVSASLRVPIINPIFPMKRRIAPTIMRTNPTPIITSGIPTIKKMNPVI